MCVYLYVFCILRIGPEEFGVNPLRDSTMCDSPQLFAEDWEDVETTKFSQGRPPSVVFLACRFLSFVSYTWRRRPLRVKQCASSLLLLVEGGFRCFQHECIEIRHGQRNGWSVGDLLDQSVNQ